MEWTGEGTDSGVDGRGDGGEGTGEERRAERAPPTEYFVAPVLLRVCVWARSMPVGVHPAQASRYGVHVYGGMGVMLVGGGVAVGVQRCAAGAGNRRWPRCKQVRCRLL